MIMDAQFTARTALPGIAMMLLVGGGIVAADHASSQLAELAPARDIGPVTDAPMQIIDVQLVDSACDRIYARVSQDHVTCMPMRSDTQAFVVRVREHHLVAAIYDRAGHTVVAPTVLDVKPYTRDDKTWRVLEPGLAVTATREHGIVVLRIHDADYASSMIKLRWLDLASEPLIAVE